MLDAAAAGKTAPEDFWKFLGPHAPELSRVARMLLVIPPASASSERVFSAAGLLWTPHRSKLLNDRVRKLLFIYFNRRALKRDGAVRDAEDWVSFEEWLDSIEEAGASSPS